MNRPWVILSLQLLEENVIEQGWGSDFSKYMNCSIQKEFFVLTQRYGKFLIEGNSVYKLTPLPKATIGDAFTWLKQRINYYTFSKIICVVASHGSGYSLKIREGLEVPLETLKTALPRKIEILCLDSCMMATTEVLRKLHGVAEYLIAMEDYCGWEGFSSPCLDELLCDNIKQSGINLVDDIAKRAFQEPEGATSVSLIDLNIKLSEPKKQSFEDGCRVDPKDDLLHDYTCTLGKKPNPVVYTRSKTEKRSGLAVLRK